MHDDQPDSDQWLELSALATFIGWSVPTLRRYMADPVRPLPHHHIRREGKARGLILVSKHEFTEWVKSFPPADR